MRLRRLVMFPPGVARLRVEAGDAGYDIAGAIARDMRRLAPVDTGELVASIHRRRVSVRKSRITIGASHWRYVEYNTRPHAIVSHGDYPLRNRRTGQTFGRRVWHPGTTAQPFIRPSVYIYRTSR